LKGWRTTAEPDSTILEFQDFRSLQREVISGEKNRGYIDRVVIDGVITSVEFLTFLAGLPLDCIADVLFVEPDGAFLSASSGDGKRVLYKLEKEDIDFYCAVNALRANPAMNAAETCESAGRMKKVRVLVAEDDKKTRELLGSLLAQLGCEALVARTGFEAIRVAGEQRPQVIFLDGLMPEMHGFEVARVIRRLDEAYVPRIVMLTGIYKTLNYRNEAKLRYGIDGYLTKPVVAETFASAIFDEGGDWSLTKAHSTSIA